MKILVDTSIWIDHFRRGDSRLEECLDRGDVVIHPFIIGELMLGHLPSIASVIDDLNILPTATVASAEEVLAFIKRHKLAGKGIGYVDAHLLAATALTTEASFWTRDKRLQDAARSLALAAQFPG
jgi:predicted nucleic acid-binding protein